MPDDFGRSVHMKQSVANKQMWLDQMFYMIHDMKIYELQSWFCTDDYLSIAPNQIAKEPNNTESLKKNNWIGFLTE